MNRTHRLPRISFGGALVALILALPTASLARVPAAYGKLPLAFEENRGQTHPEVRFVSRGGSHTLWLTPTEAVLALRSPQGKAAVVRMNLRGANPTPSVHGLAELSGRSHHFRGNDPAKWVVDVPRYAKVCYEGVYPGIDLVYRGSSERELEYDFVVSPGTDPGLIRLAFRGADALSVDANGDLVVRIPGGALVERAPFVYQEVDGAVRSVKGGYVLLDADEIGFRVGAYDSSRPLVIDPVLAYSTYLGGSASDTATDLAVDATGSAYVTGDTFSSDFPTVGSTQASTNGDVFVAKLSPSGSSLEYVTFLDGGSLDLSKAIAVDASGQAHVTGVTHSESFPTHNAIQGVQPGGLGDAFVTKLTGSGNGLVYSTYLGGDKGDFGYGLTVNASGEAYVVGMTTSNDFPTAGAAQPLRAGDPNQQFSDAFVTKLTSSGALSYSTFLGGANNESAYGIAVDPIGNAYVTGHTGSSNFPTVAPFQAAKAGPTTPNYLDVFVTKLASSGTSFTYSTYFGGGLTDIGTEIAVDDSGNATVTGFTQSPDLPTKNPVRPAHGGGTMDGFVAGFDASGGGLRFSTYLGGGGHDEATDVVLDASGAAYVTGVTTSSDFPTANPWQASNPFGSSDVFVTQLTASGDALEFSTFLGSFDGSSEVGTGIDVDASGSIYVAGYTQSSVFPTVNALQPGLAGGTDAFVAKFSRCGDSVLDPDEACDAGAANGTTASCCSLECHLVPAGTACDDENACTEADRCDGSGACSGPDPVVCTASDSCHAAGICDPDSGCSDPVLPDGFDCDDGTACTRTDTCQGGVCTGSDPVVCEASDACHVAGTCDPGSGLCSNPPAPSGAACEDGDPCTGPDVCNGQGSCSAGSLVLIGALGNVPAALACVASILP